MLFQESASAALSFRPISPEEMGSSSPSPSFRPASPADMRLSPVLSSVIAAATSAPSWNAQFAQVENYLQFFREWDKALLLHSKCSNVSFRQLTCSRFLLNSEAAAQMNDSQLQVMIRLLHFFGFWYTFPHVRLLLLTSVRSLHLNFWSYRMLPAPCRRAEPTVQSTSFNDISIVLI